MDHHHISLNEQRPNSLPLLHQESDQIDPAHIAGANPNDFGWSALHCQLIEKISVLGQNDGAFPARKLPQGFVRWLFTQFGGCKPMLT